MKPQDILFILVLLIMLVKRNPKHFAWVGLACLILAIPLFHFLVFFTAERLVWYAVAYILVSVILFGQESEK